MLIVAASATPEPDMPAKKTLVMMLTWPSPPFNLPTRHIEKSIRGFITPIRFMISPTIINSTMAIRANTSSWLKMRWGRTARKLTLSTAMNDSTAAAPKT